MVPHLDIVIGLDGPSNSHLLSSFTIKLKEIIKRYHDIWYALKNAFYLNLYELAERCCYITVDFATATSQTVFAYSTNRSHNDLVSHSKRPYNKC